MRVLGIAGSLRRASYNRALIDAARGLLPPSVTMDVFELDDIPLYNADHDLNDVRPFEVERLKTAIANAGALLIATPEYNHSIPGVLQNAIDWASRPALKSSLVGKPIAIMGASPGLTGTARAQQQLKLVLMSTLANVMPHRGVLVGLAHQRFDASGALTDEPTREVLRGFLSEFAAWAARQSILTTP